MQCQISVYTHPTATQAPQEKWEPPLLVTALPDGVSISGSEDLLQIVASWDIVVTLEPPPHPAVLAERVADLYGTSKQSSVINCTLSTTAVISLLVFLFYHFHRYFVL